MAIKDLIPWNRGRDISVRRGEEINPFLTLHREMNRLFDDVFRGFDLAPAGLAHSAHLANASPIAASAGRTSKSATAPAR